MFGLPPFNFTLCRQQMGCAYLMTFVRYLIFSHKIITQRLKNTILMSMNYFAHFYFWCKWMWIPRLDLETYPPQLQFTCAISMLNTGFWCGGKDHLLFPPCQVSLLYNLPKTNSSIWWHQNKHLYIILQ